MKPVLFLLAAFLLAGGIFSANAQSLIDNGAAPGMLTEMADKTTAMDPDRLTFGLYFNPLGFLTMGPLVGAEFTIKSFVADIHVRFPQAGLMMRLVESGWDYFDVCKITGGFGLGIGIKYFMHTETGGFYVGPFFEYSKYEAEYKYKNSINDEKASVTSVAFGGNIGYKFVWSHIYLRLGAYLGGAANTKNEITSRYGTREREDNGLFFFMADLALGVCF